MGIWSWKRPDNTEEPSGDIAKECEAFLQGTLVEYLDSAGCIIPSWAWVNALAHGTEDQIMALATGAAPQYEAAAKGTEWNAIASLLALEILGLARATGRSVFEIQHSKLVDVELALARECGTRWPNASEVVDRTLAALRGHPSDRR